MKKLMSIKSFMLIILILILNGCFKTIGYEEMIGGLNDLVGKSLSYYSRNFKNDLRLINKGAEYNEYEINRGDGCTFALLVENTTDTIKSWRLTSPETQCKKPLYVPSV